MRKEGKAKVLTAQEFAQASALQKDKQNGLRNVALLAIPYYCGLRAKEIAGLLLDDVLTADRHLKTEITLRRVYTKGGKIRRSYLAHPKLRAALAAYLHTRRQDRLAAPLFRSQKGREFSPNSMQRLFSHIYQEARIEGATSQSGRRTFATNLLKTGANIKELQVLMGHASLTTTAIYVQEDPERLSALVKRLR